MRPISTSDLAILIVSGISGSGHQTFWPLTWRTLRQKPRMRLVKGCSHQNAIKRQHCQTHFPETSKASHRPSQREVAQASKTFSAPDQASAQERLSAMMDTEEYPNVVRPGYQSFHNSNPSAFVRPTPNQKSDVVQIFPALCDPVRCVWNGPMTWYIWT